MDMKGTGQNVYYTVIKADWRLWKTWTVCLVALHFQEFKYTQQTKPSLCMLGSRWTLAVCIHVPWPLISCTLWEVFFLLHCMWMSCLHPQPACLCSEVWIPPSLGPPWESDQTFRKEEHVCRGVGEEEADPLGRWPKMAQQRETRARGNIIAALDLAALAWLRWNDENINKS